MTKIQKVFLIVITLVRSIIVLSLLPLSYIYLYSITNSKRLKIKSKKSSKHISVAYLRTDFSLGLRVGGSLSHIAGFCNGLARAGHKPLLISTDSLANIEEIASPLYVIHPPDCGGLPLTLQILSYNIFFLRHALRIIRRREVDIICQRHSALNISGVLLSKLARIPIVLEYNSSSFWKRDPDESLKGAWLLRIFEKMNLLGADSIMVVSSVLKDDLVRRNVPANKVIVNPNGVDAGAFNPDVDGKLVRQELHLDSRTIVGFAGIYGPWHGVEFLARAVKRVAAARGDVFFLFVGDAKLKRVVEEIGMRDGSRSRMVLVEAVPHIDIPAYLAACDILVSPHVNMADGSRFFGSPVKLFEYMAMGKAIVASEIEQLAHVLQNDVNALLVPPGDVPEIASAILRLSKDAGLRKQLGDAARKRCLDAFTWQHNVQRFVHISRCLL
jgi:glycosyltransferase involved in cell wall biosynthesis